MPWEHRQTPWRAGGGVSRREVLRVSGVGLVGATAGCAGVGPSPKRVDLVVFNHATRAYTVEIGVYDEAGDSRSDARRYDAGLDLEPEGEVRRADIVPARPYVVRYSVYTAANGRRTDQGHVHYYPTDDPGDDTLAFDLNADGILTRR